MARAAEVERELSDPATAKDARKLASLGREHQRLVAVVQLATRLAKSEDELVQARELVSIDDPDMACEAASEVDRLSKV